MADDAELVGEDEEEEEEEGKKEEKKGLPESWIKILTYSAVIFVAVLISILFTLLYVELKPSTAISSYSRSPLRSVAAPRDVYLIPEFKLALDKRVNEAMTTIVQVKLGLAYEADNQQVLNEIIKRKEQIRDKVQYIIAKKRYEDVDTSESREKRLKKDLKYELNKIMKSGKILNIYFDTFVISRVAG